MTYPTLSINLTVPDPGEALRFYRSAFGAEDRFRLADPKGEGVIHAEMTIDGALITLSVRSRAAESGAIQILLQRDDIDAAFERAVAAGAVVERALKTEFHGHRCGCVRDPFGHEWMLFQQLENLTPAEMQTRLESIRNLKSKI